jgi:putative ABC transport system permease protein
MRHMSGNKPVLRVAWRYLFHHPWQGILMILGIALGVAVVVSIDLANASASRAFDLSTEAVAGKATHQVIGGPGGLDQEIYVDLKTSAVQVPLAPVIQAYVVSNELGGYPLQLLGIDPFADAPFAITWEARWHIRQRRGSQSAVHITGAIFRPARRAIWLINWSEPQFEIAGRSEPVHIAGFLTLSDELSACFEWNSPG